ncbi:MULTISPECIES: DUF1360 domain-containing protein [Bacillales]|jgi:hypothetical protein|uniref:DUF1360 domain-containing protein n=1 Tax=Brevibacillus TaxID=55080 RepID=UPI001490B561|nr:MULTISPECIES: DUF1360 domain-containing protein [Bacillales]MBR8660846.1 DUF1360 domain-containing protein [Brevibacillus sp. NL20B1]NNV03446.1 DUF1360 domain-containing protein [Brevibacillus sp. MCWH]UFJ59888.1 DUF1360 domain-containing protein [Anoxybacillus sediminis]
MEGVSWLDLAILVLASFRLTHLIVFDEITAFLRAPFFTEKYETDAVGQLIRHIEFHGEGLRRWLGMLLSCHWCVGIWAAAAVVALYVYVPAAFPLLLLLAVAGAAAVIETKLYTG